MCTDKNEFRRIEHRAQFGAMHSFVVPASPTLHALLVPCHRRRSFPRCSPSASKFHCLSTSCLMFGFSIRYGIQGILDLLVRLIFVSNHLRADYFIDETNGRVRYGMSPGGSELFSHFEVL